MASGPDPGGRSRFAKLGMAINEELTQACRDVLEMEVPPGLVYSKVKASSIYKNIRHEQELRLIGAKTDGYKEFDITLLYTLIRNICTKIPSPTKSWGGNTMPSAREITIGDDVERIRLIRNNMFGHISSASTSLLDFDDTWSIITDICQRLQTYTKKDYMSGLSNIQSQALEEEYETTVIEKLREEYKNSQSLMEKISSVEQDLQELKTKFENKENTLVKEILDNWREDDITFISTRASEVVKEKLESLNLITVVGNSGSGKSAIIQHIALILKEQGWNVIPVDKLEEVKKICSSGVSENRILFVFNDPLGKESLDEVLYHSWKSLEKTLEICLKKNKLLISCRRCIFYDKRVKGNLFDESTAVEIDNKENGLTVKEKESIFNHTLHELNRSYVKRVGNAFQFLHDFIMEITTLVFGVDCPQETIQYADSGFLRRRVMIEEDTEKEDRDPFTVYLPEDMPQTKLKEYPIFSAVCANVDSNLLKFLSLEYKKEAVDEMCMTPLILAAANTEEHLKEIGKKVEGDRRNKTILSLLKNGAKINMCGIDGVTPLYIACQNGHQSTVQLLLTNSADIHLCDKDGKSPLYVACRNGHDNTVKLLLNNGSQINSSDNDGINPLFIACQNGHDSTVQLLLNNGAKINSCDNNGRSPLYIACQNGHDNTVHILLNKGAEINLCNRNGYTPLHIACYKRHESTVQILLKRGAEINSCDRDGKSALYTACFNGLESMVKLLLNNGAKLNAYDKNGITPLYQACNNKHENTVQLLLVNGADSSLCTKNSVSPLQIASYKGYDSMVHYLLTNGAKINLSDNHGASPLWKACQNGHERTVIILLKNGADISINHEDGSNPLSIASENGYHSIVQLLLNKSLDTNLCDKNGKSPLYKACINGHFNTVHLLLNNGADINLCNKNGVSPLYIACKNGHDSTVQLLLKNGADINLCNNDGFSPLSVACENGHDSTVKLLLHNGADINLCDSDGKNSLFIACKNGHDSTV
ncbi:serine/threonine-protein phosphatase 6 regulatory ankyrin repeat subunit C-like, partial [Saccostrea cucullata]|uniref:serine/threonine-protein phosphatase 6 regulatory ankyrin repeat subunit C-like n=1 Tax=Saccostrea cuccullata TaxID=36930 RepID=UPI002ECFDDBD